MTAGADFDAAVSQLAETAAYYVELAVLSSAGVALSLPPC